MKRTLLIAPAVLLAFSLAGCTGGVQASPTANPAPSAPASSAAAADRVLAQAEEGQDLGNGRPTVSYDGLMVRRRVVVAVHTALDADIASIRKRLDAAAAARGTALSAISPDVLEPAVLQQMVPEVIVALPPTATPDDGRIIVIGSVNGDVMPFPGGAAYALTKSAVQGMVRGLARDFGPRGITVNAIQPGPTDTDMNPASGPMADQMHSFMAIKRHIRGDEIAELTAYLAGPHAAMMTGALHTIDGGMGA